MLTYIRSYVHVRVCTYVYTYTYVCIILLFLYTLTGSMSGSSGASEFILSPPSILHDSFIVEVPLMLTA